MATAEATKEETKESKVRLKKDGTPAKKPGRKPGTKIKKTAGQKPGRPKGSTNKKPGRPKGSTNKKPGRPKGSKNKTTTSRKTSRTTTNIKTPEDLIRALQELKSKRAAIVSASETIVSDIVRRMINTTDKKEEKEMAKQLRKIEDMATQSN